MRGNFFQLVDAKSSEPFRRVNVKQIVYPISRRRDNAIIDFVKRYRVVNVIADVLFKDDVGIFRHLGDCGGNGNIFPLVVNDILHLIYFVVKP